jgi:hypothetical protein
MGGGSATGGGSTRPDAGLDLKTDFTVDSAPQSVRAGDLNGDGKPDLVTGNGVGTISVLLNTTMSGSRTPTFAPHVDLMSASNGGPPARVAIADLNADGRLDVIATHNTTDVFLFTNEADGGFTQTSVTVATNARAIAVGDFNDDGKPDVVVRRIDMMGATPAGVTIFLNTTASGQAPSFANGVEFSDFAMGQGCVAAIDLNGDGKPDVATDYGAFLNTTASGAATPVLGSVVPFGLPQGCNDIASADFNHDGKQDLVITGTPAVQVLLNTTAQGGSTPGFGNPITLFGGMDPWGIAAADVDGDGLPDIVAANASSASVSVFFNLMTSSSTDVFTGNNDYPVGASPYSVVVADLNADGVADVAVTHAPDVAVLLGH